MLTLGDVKCQYMVGKIEEEVSRPLNSYEEISSMIVFDKTDLVVGDLSGLGDT